MRRDNFALVAFSATRRLLKLSEEPVSGIYRDQRHSEEYVVSFFRVQGYEKQETSMQAFNNHSKQCFQHGFSPVLLLGPDEGDIFLRKVG
jgi:hypothetical protein